MGKKTQVNYKLHGQTLLDLSEGLSMFLDYLVPMSRDHTTPLGVPWLISVVSDLGQGQAGMVSGLSHPLVLWYSASTSK